MVAPYFDSIKFNSTAAFFNFFVAYVTILNAPSLVSFIMCASDASAIIYIILTASASNYVILRDTSSVVSTTIFTTPWMIRLMATASESINFNYYDTISNLLCISAAVLSATSLIFIYHSLVSIVTGASTASVVLDRILRTYDSPTVIFFSDFSFAFFSASSVAFILSSSCSVVYS